MQIKFNNKIVKLDTVYSLEVGVAAITETGIRYLKDALNIASLPSGFDRRWMTDKGALPKRLSKFLKKEGRLIEEDKYSAICANLKNKYCTVPKVHYFDITKDFTWRPGEFGDDGSCYWNSGPTRGFRGTLTRLKGLAFRLYKNSTREKGSGIGRCWMIPVAFDEEGNPTALIAYNAYGPELHPMMEIFSQYFGGLSSKNVYISLRGGPANDGLYINNSGEAILIGSEEATRKFDFRDNINLANYFFRFRCFLCNSGIEFEDGRDGSTKYLDNWVCRNCAMNYFICPGCLLMKSSKTSKKLVDKITKERTRILCLECNIERKKQESKEESSQKERKEGEEEDASI